MGDAFNILISAAGRRVALLNLFRDALRDVGVPGAVLAADMSRLSAAFHLADRAFLVPPCLSPEFVPSVLSLCQAEGIRLIVPTIDTELPIYAAHRAEFEAVGTTVAVSAPEVIEIAGRKDRTHAWLLAKGFPTVRQAAAAEVLVHPSTWPFPLIVKPAGGSASIGVSRVADPTALAVAARVGDAIVQEIAPGVEHTVDVFVDRSGRARCAVPRKRLEVRAGEVSKGVTVRQPELEALAIRLAEALPGAYAALNIQMFYDEPSGAIHVIEINARFGGGHPLACAAGAPFPRWLLEELLGRPCTAAPDAWREGVVMLRWDDAVFVDAAAAGLTP